MTCDLTFQKLAYGSVKTIFKNSESSSSVTSPIFHSLAIIPVAFEDDILAFSFNIDESKAYVDKVDGNFIWDVDPSIYDPDYDCWFEEESNDEVFIPIHRRHGGKKNEPHHQPRHKGMPIRKHYSLNDLNSPCIGIHKET